MKQIKREYFIGGFICAATVVLVLLLFFPQQHFQLMTPDFAPEFVKKYINDLNNEKRLDTAGNYHIYTAYFGAYDRVPHLWKKDKSAVLWLGSTTGWNDDTAEWSNFGKIIISQPFQIPTLKKVAYGNFLFAPEGIAAESFKEYSRNGRYFVVVGEPDFAEDILNRLKLPYRKYGWNDADRIIAEADGIYAVIAGNYLQDADIPQMPWLLLKIAANGIPLIGRWQGEHTVDPVYWFDDKASFYLYEDDAVDLFKKVVAGDKIFELRAKKAQAFIKDHYLKENVLSRLSAYFLQAPPAKQAVTENSMLIDLPTMSGHYGAGDYWIAKDIEQAFFQKGYHPELLFSNSVLSNPAKIHFFIRGYLNRDDLIKESGIRLFYLMYPGWNVKGEKDYLQQLKTVLKQNDVAVSTSRRLTEILKAGGYETYYIPQFTNPERFYPDYDGQLKSEVLFIGNFHFMRVSPLLALKAGLPLTIYGDFWDKVQVPVKAKYADNRILRKYYSSAKIVLNDTLPKMKKFGIISNRIFDATASGALVISDYLPEIEEIYGDSVPMWKTEEEFVQLVKYYLEHDKERQEKARRAREITLKYFTVDNVIRTFDMIIRRKLSGS